VRPHPDDLHDSLAAEDLVNEAVVDVDAAREGAGEIAEEFFERRRRLERIDAEDFEQGFGFGIESGAAELLCVFRGLWGEDNPPGAHQSSDSRHSLTGVANPFRMDARIPGMESRYSVS
jgi:hypothetical protein